MKRSLVLNQEEKLESTRVGRALRHWLDKYLEDYSLSPGNIMLCGLITRNMGPDLGLDD